MHVQTVGFTNNNKEECESSQRIQLLNLAACVLTYFLSQQNLIPAWLLNRQRDNQRLQ